MVAEHLPVIEESSSENHGIVIAPVRGVAPLESDRVPVMLVSHKTNQSVREGLPCYKTKLSLEGMRCNGKSNVSVTSPLIQVHIVTHIIVRTHIIVHQPLC